MAADHSREPGQEPTESLIDDLIRDILNDAGQSKTAGRGRVPGTALIETAVISSPNLTVAPRQARRTTRCCAGTSAMGGKRCGSRQ